MHPFNIGDVKSILIYEYMHACIIYTFMIEEMMPYLAHNIILF